MWRRMRRRLRALFRRRTLEREMDEELRFHVEMEAAELARTEALTAWEARRRALVAFGGADSVHERAREVYGVRWLDDLVQDLRQAVRQMRRTPGLAATAVLTLALGIGATTAIFSVVDGALLKPLPFPESDRLVSVWGRFDPESGFAFPQFPLSPPEYGEYRQHTRALTDVAAYNGFRAALIQSDGAALSTRGAATTANLFAVLGVQPALGRTPSAEEASAGGPTVVVLGHGLWQRAFGGDPGVIGGSIRLNGRTVEVAGVMPAGFAYPTAETELWTLLSPDELQLPNRSRHFLQAVGRLADGASVESARTEMEALMQQWRAEYPDVHTGHYLFVRPLLDDVVAAARPALLALLGAVGIVLLIVCVNVMNLLLARGEARQRELAVRSALGAGRQRLARQFLAEGAILSLAGAVGGVGLAYVGLRVALGLGANSIPRATEIALDARVLVFCTGIALLTTLVFTLAPVLTLRLAEPRLALGDDGRSVTAGRTRLRLRSTLVAAQVAMAVIVVIGAGLAVRSFGRITSVDVGFRATGVLAADLSLPGGDYPDAAAVIRTYEALRERLSQVPGARSAAAVSTLPLGGGASNIDFDIEDAPPPAPGEPAHSGDMVIADPGYAATLGVAVLQGRFFEAADRLGSLPVAVVSRTLARTFWPDGGAVGRRIRVATNGEDVPWLTIVGIVEDVQFRTPADAARPAWYIPLAQMPLTLGTPARAFTVAVSTDGNPMALASAVRAAVRAIDAGLPVIRLRPLEDVVAASVEGPRFAATVLAAFALLALVLGMIGIYGVLSWAVARRTREFGIRVALGASQRNLTTLVLGMGLRVVLAGLIVGLTGALVATRLIQGLLFGVSPTDPAIYAGVAVAILVIALVACAVPLARVLGSDPVRTLRAP